MRVNVNNKAVEVRSEGDTPLLWVLRDELGLTGTKFGCGIAACGACMVHVDGQATPACVLAVESLGESKVTTIEGLSSATATAVQDAWTNHDVAQCGYCQSGQVMAAVGLLEANPSPSDEEIDGVMSTNICRCATYVRIRKAIHAAAKTLKEQRA